MKEATASVESGSPEPLSPGSSNGYARGGHRDEEMTPRSQNSYDDGEERVEVENAPKLSELIKKNDDWLRDDAYPEYAAEAEPKTEPPQLQSLMTSHNNKMNSNMQNVLKSMSASNMKFYEGLHNKYFKQSKQDQEDK